MTHGSESPRHAVFLIPGFFGFARLGGIRYFRHVREEIEAGFRRAGHPVEVFEVETLPTASIRRRARVLAQALADAGLERFDRVHLVGHSTGGLDARLLVTPGVRLGGGLDRFEDRVHSVVTIATPHFGTPMAAFFAQVAGKHLLSAMTLILIASMQGVGGASYAWAGRLLGWVTQLDDLLGLDDTVADYFVQTLLAEFTPERREEVRRFLRQVEDDQGALLQLTPESMDLFNAAATDHPGVRYWSYVIAAFCPGPRPLLERLLQPRFQASYPLFVALHSLARRHSPRYPYPDLPAGLRAAAGAAFDFLPEATDNDGVVPALSQLWGETAAFVRADHLDACGHFEAAGEGDRHVDWLTSGAGFERSDFAALYRDLCARLTGEPLPTGRTARVVPICGEFACR